MKVYGSGNFNGHDRGEQPGRPIPVGASFTYGGYEWLVPAAYQCEKNLIMDLCRKVEKEKIAAFYTKWYGSPDSSDEREEAGCLAEERQLEMDAEDPTECAVMRIRAEWNGQSLPGCCWSCDSWIPPVKELPECNAAVPADPKTGERIEAGEEGLWMEAYQLEPEQGWNCLRVRFPLPSSGQTRTPDPLTSLTLKLEPRRVSHPLRQHIKLKPDGAPFEMVVKHPLREEQFKLCLLACTPGKLPKDAFTPIQKAEAKKKRQDRIWPEYPRCYCEISYQIEPPLPKGEAITLRDCSDGDSRNVFHSHGAASVGVIGGAAAVTSCVIQEEADGKAESAPPIHPVQPVQPDQPVQPIHLAHTSLTYEPVTEVEVNLLLQSSPYGSETFDLIARGKGGIR